LPSLQLLSAAVCINDFLSFLSRTLTGNGSLIRTRTVAGTLTVIVVVPTVANTNFVSQVLERNDWALTNGPMDQWTMASKEPQVKSMALDDFTL